MVGRLQTPFNLHGKSSEDNSVWANSFGYVLILESWWQMKNIIILKWDSLVLSIVSVLYGSMLLIYPQILQGYRVYDLIDDIFDNYFIGAVFIILGCLKLLGIWINNKKIKHTSLILLATVWSVFSVSFLITPPPNTVWTFSLGMAALAFGIALKEG